MLSCVICLVCLFGLSATLECTGIPGDLYMLFYYINHKIQYNHYFLAQLLFLICFDPGIICGCF